VGNNGNGPKALTIGNGAFMTLSERFNNIEAAKFSFGKSTEHAEQFARDCGAFSMYDSNGFGLGIPFYFSDENKLRAVFKIITEMNGVFLFNISGVNLVKAKKGFSGFNEAEGNNQITEWELFMILGNKNYLKNCTFHNGKVEFKKRILWKSIQVR
jgi:hypothetical protein